MGGSSPDRVGEDQLETVEQRPIRMGDAFGEFPSAIAQGFGGLAVADITQDRMSSHLEVDPDLILATGDRTAKNQ